MLDYGDPRPYIVGLYKIIQSRGVSFAPCGVFLVQSAWGGGILGCFRACPFSPRSGLLSVKRNPGWSIVPGFLAV